jgi:hypothetical protein
MAGGKANRKIIADRLDFITRMIADIRALPLESLEQFAQDRRNFGTSGTLSKFNFKNNGMRNHGYEFQGSAEKPDREAIRGGG